MTSTPGFEGPSALLEGECFDHYATLASPVVLSLVCYWHFVLMSIKSELTVWAFSFTITKVKQKKKAYRSNAWCLVSSLKVSRTCFVVLLSLSLLLLLFSLWYVNVTKSWFKACRLYVSGKYKYYILLYFILFSMKGGGLMKRKST